MKKTLGIIIIFVVIVAVGISYYQNKGEVALKDFKNATYLFGSVPVTLINGRAEMPEGHSSVAKDITTYFGNEAYGDLNGDGRIDVAFVITQTSGGTGTFYYVVAALNTTNGYVGTNAIFLGDRIAPQTTGIKDGEIIINYADRKADEPMVTQPSVGVTKYLKIHGANLIELPPQSASMLPPQGYIVDANYHYQAQGVGKDILGTKYTIPASMVKGTNLAVDSYISVEQIALVDKSQCSASLFTDPSIKTSIINDNGVTYSIATSSDAGAGNRYEESVYVLTNTNPCTAVRYFIHYGAIENYPKGTVKEFDRQVLIKEFDAIRRSVTY